MRIQVLLFSILAFSVGVWANPPKEAVDACSGKKFDETCTFTSPRGDKLTGTCWRPGKEDDSKPLACHPPHHGMMMKKQPKDSSQKEISPENPPPQTNPKDIETD